MTGILLVADLPWVADLVITALAGDAHHLEVTADSAGAARLWQELDADVVLADLQIGSMGGMAVVREIRDTARAAGMTPPATILLLDRGVDAFLARRAGADAWIRKPFGGFALRRLVEQVTHERAAASPAP